MNFLTRNLSLKIVAFILALLFWVNVVTNKTYEYEFDVPFNLADISSDLILTTPPPDKARVRLDGTGKQLLAFLYKKPSLVYPAENFERGIYRIDIGPDDVSFDQPVQPRIVVVNEPQTLTLKFEGMAYDTLPVMADVEIEPALGFTTIGDPTLVPDSVEVSGPRRIIRNLKQISTEKVTFADVKKNIEEQISLAIDDTMFLTVNVDQVDIYQEIVPLVEKKFGPVALETLNSGLYETTEVNPDSIALIVEGPRGFIDTLDASLFTASINFRNIEAGTTSVLPRVNIPQGYRLIRTEPASVTVTALKP